jgi:hypothetical protein
MRTLMLTCLLAAVSAFAQTDRGTITGTVQDPASSTVPGAAVVARNVSNGSLFPTTTTSTGNFTLASLPAGVCELSVEAPGFKRYVSQGAVVEVAQVLASMSRCKSGWLPIR